MGNAGYIASAVGPPFDAAAAPGSATANASRGGSLSSLHPKWRPCKVFKKEWVLGFGFEILKWVSRLVAVGLLACACSSVFRWIHGGISAEPERFLGP